MTMEAGGTSMYGQLLAAAMARGTDEPATERDLVRELAHLRLRLAPRWGVDGGSPRVDAAASIAAQVEYDLTLVRLCRRRGVDSALEAFARPGLERRRLERALAQDGVALDDEG